MRYADGQTMELGDHLEIGNITATLHVIIDERLADIGFAIADWIYLENGIMVVSDVAGLMYYPTDTIDGVTLISRRTAPV